MSYTKTVWEDLPSTDTPLNATNLNNIEDGIEDVDGRIDDIDDKLNGNDIAGDMVVESIRTKNMFDTSNVFNGFINTSNTALAYETDGKRYSGYVKVEPNTTYTISKGQGYSFRIATTTNYPADSVTYNTTEANHTATSMTITTGANDNYLVFFFYAEQNGDTGGYMSMANTIQVEEGSTATSYSSFQNLDGINTLNAIWSGNLYSINSVTNIGQELEKGKLYVFEVKGLSSLYYEYIPFISNGGNQSIQHTTYDGSTAVRWRIGLTSNTFSLDSNSLNIGTNTAIVKLYKLT